MEIRNKEMHDEVLRNEGASHNKRLCAYCQMEAKKYEAERVKKREEE